MGVSTRLDNNDRTVVDTYFINDPYMLAETSMNENIKLTPTLGGSHITWIERENGGKLRSVRLCSHTEMYENG